MTPRTRALSLALSFLGLVGASSSFTAQANKKPPLKTAPKQEVSVPALSPDHKQHALELLPLLSERIDVLKSVAWKVRLKGLLAELLARHDQTSARQLFEQSLQSLDSVPVRRPQDRSGSAEGLPAFELNSLRSELLARAAKADPPSAEALVEKLTSSAQAESAEAERLGRRRASLVGQVALSLAKEQPELAVQWVEKSFETGITGWIPLALETMRQKNLQLADTTFSRALSQLESDPSGSTESVMALGNYLFPGRFPTLVSDDEEGGRQEMGFDLRSMSSSERSSRAGDAKPEMVSRFLNLAYERCLSSLPGLFSNQINDDNPEVKALANALPLVAMLRPLLEKHLPEKASSLQMRLSELSKQVPTENGMTLERALDFLSGFSDPEKRADWDAQMNAENRDFLYQAQAMTAIRQGQAEQVPALIEKIKSDAAKAMIRSALASKQISDAIEQGQLDSASAQARTHTDASQQIRFLIQIAQKRLSQKESEPALLCLIEAEQLLGKLDVYSRLTYAAEIVEKMARLDSERSFHSGARLVEEINKAGAGSSVPSPYRDGPDLLIANSFLHGESFVLMAEADFDAALALSQSIARPETSIAAQLAVCRAALSNKAKSSQANR